VRKTLMEKENACNTLLVLRWRIIGDERRTDMDACTCPASPTWSFPLISFLKILKGMGDLVRRGKKTSRPFYTHGVEGERERCGVVLELL
jgi:hypothetical protein